MGRGIRDRLRGRTADGLLVASAVSIAVGLKLFYSVATPEQLVWILGPTVALLELTTGGNFVMEASEGFLSRELNLLVAPSCAGVNFLIAAFCTGVFGFLGWPRTTFERVELLAGSFLFGYVLTVFANWLRLVVSLALEGDPAMWLGSDPDALHRIEGVAVYFTVLCVAFLIARPMVERAHSGRAA